MQHLHDRAELSVILDGSLRRRSLRAGDNCASSCNLAVSFTALPCQATRQHSSIDLTVTL